MSNFKGTQGEWKVSVYRTKNGTKSIEIHFNNDEQPIAEHVITMDDAHLISAAPDMFKAIEKWLFIDRSKRISQEEMNSIYADLKKDFSKAYNKAIGE